MGSDAIFIDINKWIIDINKWIIDINNSAANVLNVNTQWSLENATT